MNVLIAEDDPLSRVMLESILTKWGYAVTAACDGDEAWRILCEAQHPLLVILDWVMPGIEGPEIVRRVRLKEDSKLHYMIIITSSNSPDAAVMALDAGADDFITKPFNHSELRARVAGGRRIISLHQKLTEKLRQLESASEQIARLARTDDLTGLHNRRSFHEFFARAAISSRRQGDLFSLVGIDLDHFKTVNDTFGHSVGDQVLREFARLIQRIVRSEDVAVRWGGEEFLIMLSATTGEAAAALAERIRTSWEQASGGDMPCFMTASFGVAQLQGGEAEDSVIRRVDAALYRAKGAGRNRVVLAELPPGEDQRQRVAV